MKTACEIGQVLAHNDIYGKLTIDEHDVLFFEGTTQISGENLKLELEIDLN